MVLLSPGTPERWHRLVQLTVGTRQLDHIAHQLEVTSPAEVPLPHTLSRPLAAIELLLSRRCGAEPTPQAEEAEQRWFEKASYRMWRESAPLGSPLEEARKSLFEAEDGAFRGEAEEGLEERRFALAPTLTTLR